MLNIIESLIKRLKMKNITKISKKMSNCLVKSKFCCTFAPAFDKKRFGGIAQLVRAHDS